MKRRDPFTLRRPAAEAVAIMQTRRAHALQAEVERVQAGSTFWRRLACLFLPHRYWRTGLAGRTPSGTVYALHICRRCGRRAAERAQEVTP